MYTSKWWVRFVLACLGILAVLKLGSEFHRLALDDGPTAAIDLALRYFEIQHWFNGDPVYGVIPTAAYPPASYLILWPFAGWGSLQFVRWLWVALSVAWLAWLALLLIRECDARSLTERWLIALIPLSMNATGIAVGNGQLAIFIMPLLITVLLLARTAETGWRTDLSIALLFLMALVKPTFSAPFFLILLLVLPGYRAAIACVAGYILLTFLSTVAQQQDMLTLISDWLSGATTINTEAAAVLDYGSFHSWLFFAGLSGWNSHISLLMLFLLGAWIYRFRDVDLWLIFGVTALVARIWTYHGIYDDMLIIIPIIAVYRHSKQIPRNSSIKLSSLFLLSGSVFVMLLPARLFNVWEAPWPGLYAFSHVLFWLLLMIYLMIAASRERREPPTMTPCFY